MDRERKPAEGDGAGSERGLKVVAWQRRAEVLTRPKLPCLTGFHTINLSAGCPNECRYCYAQSYAHHPGWGTVAFYANAKDKLKEELARPRDVRRERTLPRLVYFSTASEPFVPAPRVLDDLYEIMAALLDAGAALVVSTKGVIPDRFVDLFARHPGRAHVQVGITTLDDVARRLIEPRAASVAERLDNLARLVKAGVGTEARIDPLAPGLTDSDAGLAALLSEASRVGVRGAVVSFLFLRWGIRFGNDLALGGWSARAMRKLYTYTVANYCGGGTIHLPSTGYRAERFAAIGSIASAHGISIKICRCKNADIPEAVCCHPTDLLVAGERRSPPDAHQLTLF